MTSESVDVGSRATRFLGWDLLRLAIVFCTTVFHVYESLVFLDQVPESFRGSVYGTLLLIARSGSFFGFSLVALSFYLVGSRIQNAKQFQGVFIKCALGLGVLILAAEGWEWDIFHLLLVSQLVLLVVGLSHNRRFYICAAFVSLGLATSLPFQSQVGCVSWPIVPWVFWPMGFFWLGRAKLDLSALSQKFWVPWCLGFFLSLVGSIWDASYYWIPLGPNFSCAVFGKTFWEFWLPQTSFVSLCVVSTHPKVQEFLSHFPGIGIFSDSAWNRRFFLSYALQFLILSVFVRIDFNRTPLSVLAVWLLVVLLPDFFYFVSKSIRPSSSAKS